MPAASGGKSPAKAVKASVPDVQPVLGRQIAREFPLDSSKPKSKKWFAGVVEKRVENSRPPLWHVVYDDADSEDLEVSVDLLLGGGFMMRSQA